MRKFSTHSVSATSLFKNFSHHEFVRPGFMRHDRPNRLRFLFINNLFLFILSVYINAKIWRVRETCASSCKNIWSIWWPWSWQSDPNIINKFSNVFILSICRSKIHHCYTTFFYKESIFDPGPENYLSFSKKCLCMWLLFYSRYCKNKASVTHKGNFIY